MPDLRESVKTIFGKVLEIHSDDERSKYLDQACAGDVSLRSELDDLLGAIERAGNFLGGSPPAIATIDQPITEKPGETIGAYKLLQQIGEGGMGVVFMAEQTEPIQRTIALKIIKPGMDTRQVIARFEAERQAVAMMDHPNIAKVLDAGTTDSGRPYFVMELVKGVPITKYCDDKHLPIRDRLELFIQVCQAVQHAHQKGIIHRDIKPNNVLVAEYDHHSVPKVIDFGVAKATAQKLTERTMFTEFGQVLGTMEYMSPEQSKFNQLDIDTRSDIYSLGVLLYELLAGSTPFEGKRLHEAAFDEMLRIIREEEPPKPSTRLTASDTLASIAANRHIDPARLSKDVRGELDWIVMKALEKDRNRRYETASGFAADIERHLHVEPVEAGPPSAAYRFRKFARRNKAALIAGSVVAAALFLGLVGTTWQAIRATHAERVTQVQRDRALEAEKLAKTEAAIARAANDFLNHDLLSQADPSISRDQYYNDPSGDLKLRTVLNRASSRIEGRFQDQPLVEAALRQTIGATYRNLGETDRALSHFRRAVELRRAQLGEEHPDTLTSMASLAGASRDSDLTRRVLEVRRRLLGKDHPDTLRSMYELAWDVRERAREQGLKVKSEERPAEADMAPAVVLFREVFAAQRRVLGDENPNTAATMYALAFTLSYVRCPSHADADEVEALFRQAQRVFRNSNGDRSTNTYTATLMLGKFLL
jgi:serine/threonine protein kinase